MNCTVNGPHPLVGLAINDAVGGVATTTVWVEVEVPQALVEVSVTVYVPSLAYACVGFVAVLVWLSPKFHKYDVALVEVLVKATFAPLVLLVKPVVGTVLTVM